MELLKLEFILDYILEVNMTAYLVHKDLRSTIRETLLLENALTLDTLKVVYAVVMVDVVDEVDVIRFVVVSEEVEARAEVTLKAKLQQS